ncbi:hypothetical protein G7074_14120 [Pedobacter sp. HDW13]|uniref:hypothetical protein n=1 Tax=unclassified Pedobacter TaxID=2628915 RepID=UPI000F5A1FDF|nr:MULTISPECIES: hypothetical protein [unclassified Pedobacter]QIL40295.1 hypothetical protein G7074_14120 [Pedobacter sp. HDW13]
MIHRQIIYIFLFVLCTGKLYAQEQLRTKQEKGYFNVTEFGIYPGSAKINLMGGKLSSSANIRSIRTTNGLFINPNLSLGIGIGLDGVDTDLFGFYNTFNITADARYYLKNSRSGFFFYGIVGPSVKIDDNFSDGFLFNVGAGHKFTLGKSFVLVPGLGFDHQYLKNGLAKYNVESLAIKIGVLF